MFTIRWTVYLSRIVRWLVCRHKWDRYTMDSQLIDWNTYTVTVCEPLNTNCARVAICRKCGEVRSIGKEQTLW